ncbi:MAG TPA: translocation/assembly module TamB domain-containing protein [Vicinamibacteria bacterium]|nr:translocation/assembly module TamB domain-containing protein [Vicinamibacteria bacterium]
MSGSLRRRAVRWAGWAIGLFASFLAVLVLVIAAYLLLWDYPEKLRAALEQQLTELSGAPAHVGSIYLNLPLYAFELRDISLSAPGREEPVLEIETIRGKLRLATLLTLELRWGELRFEGLTISLTEDREKGLVLPSGRSEATRLAGITLAADRITVSRAVVRVENQRVPWTLQASDLSMDLERLRDGRFGGRFAYGSGDLKIKDHKNLSAGLESEFELVPNELFLREVRVTSDFGSLRGTGKIGFAGGAHARFDLEAEGESGKMAEAIFGLEGAPQFAQGSFSFRGMLTATPESKTLEGTLVLPEGRLAGIPVANWRGEVFWDRSILSIGYARGAFASGSARFQLEQPLPVAEHLASLSLDLEDASLETIVSGLSGVASPLDSRVSGGGTFSFPAGRPGEIEGSFELEGKAPSLERRLAAATPLSFRVKADVKQQRLAIEDLQLETPFLEGSLRGVYPRDGAADLWMAIESADLSAARVFQRELERALAGQNVLPPDEWGVEGRGTAFGHLRERFPRLVFEGEIAAEALSLAGVNLGTVQTRAIVSRDAVTFEDLSAGLDGGTLSGRGFVSFLGPSRERDFDLDLELERFPASGLPYRTEGRFSGNVRASRAGERLEGAAELELTEGTLNGIDVSRARTRVELNRGAIRFDPLSLERGEAVLEGHLALDPKARTLTGIAKADRLDLDGLAPSWAQIKGFVDGEIELSGTYAEPLARLTGHGEGIEVRGVALGDAEVTGRVLGSDLELSVALKRGSADVALETSVLLSGDYLARGRLEWSGIDVAPWMRLSPEGASLLTVTATGEADFRVPTAAADPVSSAEVEAVVSTLVLQGPAFRVASVTPARMFLQGGRLELSRVALSEAESTLFVGGAVDFRDRSLDIEAEGVASLGLLQTFYPAVATTGETTLSARIGGTLDRPAIEGHADFESGSIRLESFRQALGGLRGRVVFDNRTVRFPELQAVFGSGPVTLTGTIALEGLRPGSVDLHLRGSGVRLRYPEGLVATLEGELNLIGSPGERMVSGNLLLSDALWTREYDLVSGILSDREGQPLFADFAENELLKDLRLDVRIRAPGSLELRNSLAVINASAELELRGTLGEPVLLGRSEASRGEMYFLGQRYDITSGKVDFVNPDEIEPFVDLTAEARVRSYRVELRLTGTPDRFYPELSSDPPLRTVDILRLLAGASDREILDTLVGNETEELAGVGVASLLTERLSQEVGKRAERLFGLDRFSVNPFLVGQFANPTARVSLGKQITRKLAVNYSTNLNSTTEAIILIEYTPEGPMSWILSRDEEGDIGVDVKFRKSF